jgi:hypothetical protein
MRIQWATICRYGESGSSGATLVGVNINEWNPHNADPPWDVQCSLAVSFTDLFAPPALSESTFSILGPNGLAIQAWSQEWLSESQRPREQHLERFERTHVQVLPIKFRADVPGRYIIQIETPRDNDEVIRLPLDVFLRSRPQ